MEKRKFIVTATTALAICCMFASCKDNDEDTVPDAKLAVTLDMPLNIVNPTLKSATAVLTNVETKRTYTVSNFRKSDTEYVDTAQVPIGTYTLSVKGEVVYHIDSAEVSSTVKASAENVLVSLPTSGNEIAKKTVALNTYNAQDGFVISEIFFSGTLTPEGKQYSDDQYIKIANNSDSTMYADGLAFVESAFLTVEKEEYKPDIMKQAMTVDAVYLIPGSGKEHPVKPGQEIILALNAKNHKELNTNSIDLSKADFEFYDVSSNPNFSDDDNPNVPNLVSWADYSYTYFGLHNRGFKAYAIAKPETDMKTFLSTYKYKYTYLFKFKDYSFDMDGEGYKIPNAWIIDAVNLSVADSYQWNVTSASLDAGWTHCGSVDHDKTRYGKSVVRKQVGGKFVDTNNSTNDFNADAKPTLFN